MIKTKAKVKNLCFHLNLLWVVWKQLREYPSAEVKVTIHQSIHGTAILRKL